MLFSCGLGLIVGRVPVPSLQLLLLLNVFLLHLLRLLLVHLLHLLSLRFVSLLLR